MMATFAQRPEVQGRPRLAAAPALITMMAKRPGLAGKRGLLLKRISHIKTWFNYLSRYIY
jgi:hypothetical protein